MNYFLEDGRKCKCVFLCGVEKVVHGGGVGAVFRGRGGPSLILCTLENSDLSRVLFLMVTYFNAMGVKIVTLRK